MPEFIVTMYRRQYEDVIVTADDRDAAIQKAWEGEGKTNSRSSSPWEWDGDCEQLD